MKIPTVIRRPKLDAEGTIRKGVEYLARDEQALFHQAEWSWVDDIAEAYQFEDSYPADLHCSQLRADGEEHAHTMVISAELQMQIAEMRTGGKTPAPRVSPEEAYARTQRILGERDE